MYGSSAFVVRSPSVHRSTRSALCQEPPKLGQKQGVYVRPSAAIERGSGFFIPGLEGPKVRLLFGSLLLVLTVVNHSLSGDAGMGNVASEGLAAIYALLVLFQGTVESLKQSGLTSTGSNTKATTSTSSTAASKAISYQQQWIVRGIDDAEWRNDVEWAASTYMVLTPATHMLLVSRTGVVFALQSSNDSSDWHVTPNILTGCTAALETLAQSQSGRVSIPMLHPTAVHLLANAKATRCMVLQRVNAELCWVMASDQLLVAFTKSDLQWLGQLAKYMDR